MDSHPLSVERSVSLLLVTYFVHSILFVHLAWRKHFVYFYNSVISFIVCLLLSFCPPFFPFRNLEADPYVFISETVQGILFNFGVRHMLRSVRTLLFWFTSGTTHIFHDAQVELWTLVFMIYSGICMNVYIWFCHSDRTLALHDAQIEHTDFPKHWL
jgi:hypothetical protein